MFGVTSGVFWMLWFASAPRSSDAARSDMEARYPNETRSIVGPVRGLEHEEESRRLARTELATCIDPEREVDLVGEEMPWFDELDNATQAANITEGMPHAQGVWRPLDHVVHELLGYHAVSDWLTNHVVPWHRAMVMTDHLSPESAKSPGMDYADSHCFTFPYDAKPGSVSDPHGCGLFRRSFSRLQTLQKCIVDELKASTTWQAYRKEIQEGRSTAPVKGDANFRADEMVKHVGFKDWAHMSSGIIDLVDRKLRESVTGVSLEPEIRVQVRSKCFKVTKDSYANLPKETIVLKRALTCQPLMWDSAEVAAAPHKPMNNAVTMFDDSLYDIASSVKVDFPKTPPICGRIALALVKKKLITAPKRFASFACAVGGMKWRDCMSLEYFNCICAEKCWVRALKRACFMTRESGGACCGDYEIAMRYNDLFH